MWLTTQWSRCCGCVVAGLPKISFRANDYQEAQAMVGIGFGVRAGLADRRVNWLPNVQYLAGHSVAAAGYSSARRTGSTAEAASTSPGGHRRRYQPE